MISYKDHKSAGEEGMKYVSYMKLRRRSIQKDLLTCKVDTSTHTYISTWTLCKKYYDILTHNWWQAEKKQSVKGNVVVRTRNVDSYSLSWKKRFTLLESLLGSWNHKGGNLIIILLHRALDFHVILYVWWWFFFSLLPWCSMLRKCCMCSA